MNTKKCTKCGETKPLSEFYETKFTPDKYTYKCKKCFTLYYIKNKEKIEKRHKKYREKNKEKRKK